MSFEFLIAKRYLKAKRKQTFISLIVLLSVIGVAVGVMALVVVIAVMSGAESDFRSRILGIESHILVFKHGGKFTDYTKTIKQVKENKHVVNVVPFIFSQVILRSAAGASGAMLRGINPDSPVQIIKNIDSKALKKMLPDESHHQDKKGYYTPSIILGKELANSLGIVKGNTLHLMAHRGMLSPVGHVPSMKRFKVTGFFETGMYEYDNVLAYINILDAQKLMRMKDSITALGIWIDNPYNAKAVSTQLINQLKYPYWTRDWMQMNQSLFAALKLEKAAMFIILILIVLVAAFNIASSLIMMVMEKTKDIAILKAMGATNKSIRHIFVLKGVVIGFIGTFTGIIVGVVICLLLQKYEFIELPSAYPFSTLPVQLEYIDVLVIAVSSMIICFLSTLYPAYQASKLNPVEAIRYG